jgi:hypothetical protein
MMGRLGEHCLGFFALSPRMKTYLEGLSATHDSVVGFGGITPEGMKLPTDDRKAAMRREWLVLIAVSIALLLCSGTTFPSMGAPPFAMAAGRLAMNSASIELATPKSTAGPSVR